MDGTLIEGRIVDILANKFGLLNDVKKLRNNQSLSGYQRTNKITKLFKGIPKDKIIEITENMTLAKNWREVFAEFRAQEHVIGIISDGYDQAANCLANKLGLDFAIANALDIDKNDLLTGQIRMPLGWEKINCYCKNSVCKRYHLEITAKKYGIDVKDTVAIGDTRSDLCMIERASVGIAFVPKDKEVEIKADVIIRKHNLNPVLLHVLKPI